MESTTIYFYGIITGMFLMQYGTRLLRAVCLATSLFVQVMISPDPDPQKSFDAAASPLRTSPHHQPPQHPQQPQQSWCPRFSKQQNDPHRFTDPFGPY